MERDRVVELSDLLVRWVELTASVVLAILAAAGVVALVVEMVTALLHPSLPAIESLFSAILTVFILLELYRIGIAFIRRQNVADRVFEVGLVALVREVIVAEFLHLETTQLLTIAALIIAIGVAWYLTRRASALPRKSEDGSAD